MGDVREGQLAQFIKGISENVAEFLVRLQKSTIHVSDDNADRRLVEDGSQPLFAHTQ